MVESDEMNQGNAETERENAEIRHVIRQHMKVVRLMAGSMMAGVVIFGALSLTLLASGDFQPRSEALPALLPFGLAAAAILMLLAGPFIMRRLASEPASSAGEVLQKHRTRVVVGYAIWEAAGVLGIILALVTGLTGWGFALAGAALLMMGMAWPKPRDLDFRTIR